jgi:hypothetical protein
MKRFLFGIVTFLFTSKKTKNDERCLEVCSRVESLSRQRNDDGLFAIFNWTSGSRASTSAALRLAGSIFSSAST